MGKELEKWKTELQDSWSAFSWLPAMEGNNPEENLPLSFDGDYDLKPEILVEGEELIMLLFVKMHVCCNVVVCCWCSAWLPQII